MKLKQKIRFFMYGTLLLAIFLYNHIVTFLKSFNLSQLQSNLLILFVVILFAMFEEDVAEKIAKRLR